MRHTLRLPIAAVSAALLLSLSACGGSDGSDDDTAPAETTSSAPAPEETTEAPAAEQTEIAVDQTITDPEYDNVIKITGLVRDFTAPSKPNIPDGGGEWVLVELDTTAGDKFSGGIQGGFTLYTGEELGGTTTGIIDDDMAAAGFTPWETASSGEQTKGWVAFQVNTRQDTYQLKYKRLAAKIIGQDKEIPEKIFSVDLPAS